MVRRKKRSGDWLLKTAILLGIFVGIWLFSSTGILADSQRKSQFDNLVYGIPVQQIASLSVRDMLWDIAKSMNKPHGFNTL